MNPHARPRVKTTRLLLGQSRGGQGAVAPRRARPLDAVEADLQIGHHEEGFRWLLDEHRNTLRKSKCRIIRIFTYASGNLKATANSIQRIIQFKEKLLHCVHCAYTVLTLPIRVTQFIPPVFTTPEKGNRPLPRLPPESSTSDPRNPH